MAEKAKGVSFAEPDEPVTKKGSKKEKKETETSLIDDSAEDFGSKESSVANCRMYEQKFPEVDDLVVVEVKSIEEMGAYVALKEYNDIEGMILLSELSRRRIRSINKIIRVGRLEVVLVLRVDKEKGYIDLSKRRVSDEDVAKCDEKYNKSKAVHSIMRHVAEGAQSQGLPNSQLEELYSKVAWPLYKKFGHAYDAFKIAMNDPNVLNDLNLETPVYDLVVKNIKRRLTPQPIKVRADLEVTCFSYEGIEAIKAALKRGEDTSSQDTPVSIKLVAPPLYVAVTSAIQKDSAIAALNTAIEAIKDEITKRKGELVIKIAPRPVHERDERELERYMQKLEQENQEVAGDDDGSGDEEEEEDE
eukprot:TRINITY_DN16916_c0_g1_i1.p1 TRINITY_DN16916_c0_g1~~TRINITY_DN16916_c0_g1_i1.p1  ORF type:complete len:379 (+),score=152.55 TRINITY_DN16916_c0_g1_i1:58-1137(+)